MPRKKTLLDDLQDTALGVGVAGVTLGVGAAVTGGLGGNTRPFSTVGNMGGLVATAHLGGKVVKSLRKKSKKKKGMTQFGMY